MLKYILFALLFLVLIINFTAKALCEKILKTEITVKKEIAVKLICFAIALVLVLIIMFNA